MSFFSCFDVWLSGLWFHGSIFLCWLQVLEETGFDVSGLLSKEEYIEVIFGQQRVRLYIIAGVTDDTAFAPLTKKEISVGFLFSFYV